MTRLLTELVVIGEGQEIEFKRALEWDEWSKKKDSTIADSSLKAVGAFLNTDGGTLLIGVDDDGSLVGIDGDLAIVQGKSPDKLQLKFRSIVSSRITPDPIGRIQVKFEVADAKTVMRVMVTDDEKEIYHVGDDVVIRDGNQSVTIRGAKLTGWIRKRLSGEMGPQPTEPPYDGVNPDKLEWRNMSPRALGQDNQIQKLTAMGWIISGVRIEDVSIYYDKGHQHVIWRTPSGTYYKLGAGLDANLELAWMMHRGPTT